MKMRVSFKYKNKIQLIREEESRQGQKYLQTWATVACNYCKETCFVSCKFGSGEPNVCL